jgi:hypothetical protein
MNIIYINNNGDYYLDNNIFYKSFIKDFEALNY